MFNKIIKYANRQFRLFSQVSSVADGRINPQISTTDIIVSVLSMYFSNLGSLNKLEGALSLGTPTKITRPPSATTIGRSADSMDLEHIREIGKNIYLKAKRSKMIEGYLGNSVGIIDGLELTSSSYPKCCHCKKRNVSKIEGVPR